MSTHVIGIALFVIGLCLVALGLSSTHPVTATTVNAVNSVSKEVASHHLDGTMWMLVGGGILALSGVGLVIVGGRRALNS